MAIRSGFFQSVSGDRRYRAEFFASYFASFIGNGVFPNPSTNLQVISDVNMNVNVSIGKGWINGYYLVNDSNYSITIPTADGVLNRIDRIVFALNFDTREMSIYNKRGTPSANPSAPVLVRDANVYELALADINVNAGTTSINQGLINDRRLDSNVCGVVTGLVQQVDVTTIYNQYDTQLREFIQDLNAILDGDAVANIIARIDNVALDLNQHVTLQANQNTLGHVRLSSSVTSTSNDLAATSSAVKMAYDRAEAAFQSAGNGKQALSVAIAGKGQTVSPTAPFSDFVTAINNISTGPASASGSVGATNNLVVSGLSFRPRRVRLTVYNASNVVQLYVIADLDFLGNFRLTRTPGGAVAQGTFTSNTNGFTMNGLGYSSGRYDWEAFEY